MPPEFSIGTVYIANAPVTAIIALLLALVIHRVLIALHFYRLVWHPILFDTAVFTIIWALITLTPLNRMLPQGFLP